MTSLAPIVLFAYNRPRHTLRTLAALSENELAGDSTLYIYLDGCDSGSNLENQRLIQEVEKIAEAKEWCKETIVIKRERNYGLADNIVGGVSDLLSKYDKVIVMEDDLVTSIGFLRYMNEALNLYCNDEKVMHVSAYMFPVGGDLPETFFYKQASCWGWGTWKRAWRLFEPDSTTIFKKLTKTNQLSELDIDGTNQFLRQLEDNIRGKIKTWAVKWHFTVILNGGLCLHPGRSLVKNIGLDGTGQHSGKTKRYNNKIAEYVNVKRVPISDNEKVYFLLKKFYGKRPNSKKSLRARIKKAIPSWFKDFLKEMVDKKVRESNREYRRLKSFPRYTPTEATLLGKKIAILDAASFLFTKNEIFGQQIYKFQTNNRTPYIIDCGANIGLSVIYFKKLYPEAEVVCFEPDPKVFSILSKNINTFCLEQVTLINRAVWDRETTLNFFSEGADGGRIAGSNDSHNVVSIKAIQLRDFIQRPVDFLKIDIEGAEVVVLSDCKDLLHNVKYLFVEYHSFVAEEQKLDELLSILRASGFRYTIQQHGVVSKKPFVTISNQAGMDILLNISAFRKDSQNS
jgi:FkbM family methyltransferase